jgi:hypothetical protein
MPEGRCFSLYFENPFPMSLQLEKIRTLFSPSAHVQTVPFAPVPFPLSVNSVDSCKKNSGTLNPQLSTLNRFNVGGLCSACELVKMACSTCEHAFYPITTGLVALVSL